MPTVSVIVTAYNHERFVAEALDSVLSQTGDFTLELVVGDDCSSDGTGGIVDAYASRFPGVVRAMPRHERLGQTKNFVRCLRAARGDYVAVCEGDDYWSRPDKLARELEFLERRPDCAFCFSAMTMRDEHAGTEELCPPHASFVGDELTFTTRDLVADNFVASYGLYRARLLQKLPPRLFELDFADWLFNIVCSEHGLIGCVNTPAVVYRVHGENLWQSMTPEQKARQTIAAMDQYDRFLDYRYHAEFGARKRELEALLAAFLERR
jgi:glycosyltransferase involved in cell wall biosynthesis